jgi:hypothetical protein
MDMLRGRDFFTGRTHDKETVLDVYQLDLHCDCYGSCTTGLPRNAARETEAESSTNSGRQKLLKRQVTLDRQ